MKITLTGSPKSTNHIYRASCRGRFPTTYLTPEGKAIKEQYQWEAKSQWTFPVLECELQVTATFYMQSQRRFDLDNANKLWMDALTGIAYKDDSQVKKLTLIWAYNKHSPHIEIDVVALGV